jgi:hypothetical protein
MPALAVLQVLTGGVFVCRHAGLPDVIDLSIRAACYQDQVAELPHNCIAGPCLTLEPSKSGVTDRYNRTTCILASTLACFAGHEIYLR